MVVPGRRVASAQYFAVGSGYRSVAVHSIAVRRPQCHAEHRPVTCSLGDGDSHYLAESVSFAHPYADAIANPERHAVAQAIGN